MGFFEEIFSCKILKPFLKKLLASASYDDTIKFWQDDDDNWICTSTLMNHTSTVWDIAFSQDGNTLFSCSDDETVIVWKLGDDDKYHLATTLTGYHKRAIYSISVNHQNYIATGCGDNGIRVFVPVSRIFLLFFRLLFSNISPFRRMILIH